jgi:hypothetical protein
MPAHLFGSNKFVTVTNCSFSTRWSIFRFGGGECENITVSNCIIYDTYGCPIKIASSGRSRFENMLFSNLVMRNVTGPITNQPEFAGAARWIVHRPQRRSRNRAISRDRSQHRLQQHPRHDGHGADQSPGYSIRREAFIPARREPASSSTASAMM